MSPPVESTPKWTHRQVVLAALGVSALMHISFVVFVRKAPVDRPPKPPAAPITINFETLPTSKNARLVDDQKARPSAPSRRTQASKPPEEQKDSIHPPGQVVSLPPPEKQEKPKDPKFASEFDHRAEKEQRPNKTSNTASPARTFVDDKQATTRPDPKPVQEEKAVSTKDGDSAQGKDSAAKQDKHTPVLGQDAFGPRGGIMGLWRAAEMGAGGAGQIGGAAAEEEDGSGADDEGEGTETSPKESGGAQARGDKLMLSREAASRIAGGAPSNDALPEDIPEGSGVFLNAQQWKYATFFNRVTDAVRRQWRPNDVIRRKRNDPTVQNASKRQTVVDVTMDRTGRLVRVRVDRMSGTEFLDEEAVRAMLAAGPFQSPPLGLFNGEETVTFRFGFQVNFYEEGGMFRVPGFGGR